MSNKHHGSSLDDFLKEEGILAAVEATARGLHDAGVMNTATLREFQRQALPLAPARIKRIHPTTRFEKNSGGDA